jgi:hypothetical protein
MSITWTEGLEPQRPKRPTSYRSLSESTRRAVNYLQEGGTANPLETYITFPTGIYDITLIAGGSGYLNPPTVGIHALGSTGGSGATATATVEAINPPGYDGSVIGLALTANGSGYLKVPAGVNKTLTPPGVSITGVDVITTFTDGDINMTTNVFTKTAHGMSDGDRVHLTTAEQLVDILPYGLFETDDIGNIHLNPDFYVIEATTDTFKLSKTSGGTSVDIKSRQATATALMTTSVRAGQPTNNMVVGVNITNAGWGYTTAPTVTFSAPPEGGTTTTGTVVMDGPEEFSYVKKITMTNYGSGYVDAPTMTFSGGFGTYSIRNGGGATGTTVIGHGATAQPVTDITGVVTGITMLTSGGGTGATATASNVGDSVASISGLSGGTGYTSPSVTFSAPPSGTTATGTATETGGVIDSVTITSSGSGYISAPSISFGGGGTSASATAVLEVHTYLTSVTLTAGGSGYETVPTVTFSDPVSGITATGIATILNGVVTGIKMTNAGSGYSTLPTFVFFGGGSYINTTVEIKSGGSTTSTGTGATATCTLEAAAVKSCTVTAGGTGYASLRSLSAKAAAVSTDLISIDKAVAVAESAIIAGWIVDIGGSGYTSPTVVFSAPSSGTTATGTAVVSGGAITAITITSGGSGYSSSPSISYTGSGTGAGGNVIMSGGSVASVRMNNLPTAWEGAGYTIANATSVKSAVDEYIVKCIEAENAIASLLAQISVSSVGNFLEHNEMLCGLQESRFNPTKVNFSQITSTATSIMKIKDQCGVPYVNYMEKLFSTLFLGDDAINECMVHLNDNPLSAGTYDPLNITDRMDVASSNATTLIAEIVVVQTPLAAWVANVSGDVGAFNTLRTNDEAELATADAFLTYFLNGQGDVGYWAVDFNKFLYTDMVGSRSSMQILTDRDNNNIT